jgi:hypothetical protein
MQLIAYTYYYGYDERAQKQNLVSQEANHIIASILYDKPFKNINRKTEAGKDNEFGGEQKKKSKKDIDWKNITHTTVKQVQQTRVHRPVVTITCGKDSKYEMTISGFKGRNEKRGKKDPKEAISYLLAKAEEKLHTKDFDVQYR